MAHQYPLDLSLPDRYTAAGFVVSDANRALHDLLMTPGDWLNPHLLLTGPEGAGKTHAGHLFAERHKAAWLTPDAPAADTMPSLIVVDDADAFDQEALFHLYNRTAQDGRLLLLSRLHPSQWPIRVPDFESRLKAMRVVDMPEPDDDLLKNVLKKLFEARVITPSDDVLEYLSRRMPRSLAHAQKIVMGLEAYANGRAFTRTLARQFIETSENMSWFDDWDGI
ncbi:MAG: DnaA/Hda family protein [Asticcacaulis sp.]